MVHNMEVSGAAAQIVSTAHGTIPDAANPVFILVSFRRRDPKGLC
jgi:hypothetical protein